MRKHMSLFLAFVLLGTMLLTACGGGAASGFKVGMVTDMGGIDDKSFNATTWKGVEMAIDELKIEGSYLESQQQTDYATNITQLINQDTDLIITVGFLLGDDTAKFAPVSYTHLTLPTKRIV